jgi:CRP/FNR family transcriptional regulator
MFIIVSGEVEVSQTQDAKKAPEILAFRHPGDYVGEMAILDQEPRMATLIARGEVRLLCLKQKQLEGIMRERPEISLGLMRVLSRRLREVSRLESKQSLQAGKGR